jgi:hypothetical protein
MTTSVYPNFPAAGRPMELLGLQGPYIGLAAAAFLADFLFFVIIYCIGVAPWLCILLPLGLGTAGWATSMALSKRFGQNGLTKQLAARGLPKGIRLDNRQTFLNLIKK